MILIKALLQIPGSLAALPSEVLALTGVDITSMLPGAKSL